MPYTTVVAGTTATAAWANANVRDQVVTPFANAAARDSAITSPIEGMLAYLQDVDLVTYYNGSAWAPMPGSHIAYANRTTSSSTTTTTEIGVLRLDSVPIVSGVSYRIWTSPISLLSTVTADVVTATIRASTSGTATTASSTVGNPIRQVTNSSQPAATPLSVVYTASTTGSLSVLLTVVRVFGTGNVSIFGTSEIMVESIGRLPADTGVDL